MGRIFFPTYSLNRFGVRDTNQRATLGAVQRFDAEPTARASNAPTGAILGAVADGSDYWGRVPLRYPPMPGPPRVWNPPSDFATPPAPASSGGGGAVPQPTPMPPVSAPPVSTQVGPTPTVTTPPAASTGAILVSSGGGTQTPSTATIVAAPASRGFVDGISAWLSGSTPLFGYTVPNALLAGVVILTFAWIESSGSGTGRKR